jgi:2,4-dienoyl-CoA reductase-like NADH-dependent reductase (Old Yellow Enzyme family)
MWKPAERVRWELLEPGWPTAEEAARSRLFSPVRVGAVALASRTWVPAMVPWRATAEGFVTADLLAWYERFAHGRPGALVVEATGIRDIPSGPLLRAGDDRFVPGLAKLVETVRRASGGETRLFLQLIDFLAIRRRPEKEKYFARYLAITDRHRERLELGDADKPTVRAALAALDDDALARVLEPREYEAYAYGYRERVTDTHLPQIAELPRVLPGLFAAAAGRARAAGFDGVELHYAHAYTMASFLSRRNTRADGYGGGREGRIRLPLEVLAVVRAEVGADWTVGCRYLSEESIEDGSELDDALYFGVELARAGMDFLSLSRGGKFEDARQPRVGQAVYPYTGRSGWECMPSFIADARGPFGRNVEPARAIREAVRAAGLATPIVVTGGVHAFAQAEAILESGAADVVGAARQALADPDWWTKMRAGRGAAIRRCTYTNYCEALDQQHKPVTCRLWDREALDEPGAPLTDDRKRRLLAPD